MTPHNLTFTIPEPLNRYINISPRYGLIQGRSSFAAQLKLQPTKELFDTEYIDTNTGILRAPIDINIMNQVIIIIIPVTALMNYYFVRML